MKSFHLHQLAHAVVGFPHGPRGSLVTSVLHSTATNLLKGCGAYRPPVLSSSYLTISERKSFCGSAWIINPGALPRI